MKPQVTWLNRRMRPTVSSAIAITVIFIWLASLLYLDRDSSTSKPNPSPVITVYVPAGPQVCPKEDSCRLDYIDGRWTIVPGVVSD